MENENQKDIQEEKVVEQEKREQPKEVKIAEPIKETSNKEEKPENKKGLCIAAMVLGIVSIVLCCLYGISIICGILAIIFGIIGLKSVGRGMAISGIITGAIGIFISITIFVLLFIVGFSAALYDNGILENTTPNRYNSRYKSDIYEFD